MTSLSDPPCLIVHELDVENAVWILHTLSTWECTSNERGNLCQTSQDARKIGALPVCPRNATRMAFRWRGDRGPRLDSGWVYSRIIYQIKTS